MTLYQNEEKRKVRRRKGTAHVLSTTSCVKHGGGSIISQDSMAAHGRGSLVFLEHVTADRSIGKSYEVYGAILSAHIQPNAAKLVRRHFTAQMDPNLITPPCNCNPRLFEGKEMEYSSMPKSVN